MPELGEVIVVPKRRAGRRKKSLGVMKLDLMTAQAPASPENAMESLLIFDARCLDKSTRQELLRILPQIVQARRAWRAEYMEYGCIGCQKPDPTVTIAARLRRRGATWTDIYEITAPSATTAAERKRFQQAVYWKLAHFDGPTQQPSNTYGAGGFCNACWGRIYQRMRNRYRKLMAGRDIPAELVTFTEALTLKFRTAHRLLNGDDE